jgi:menaquinone-dependent protoporphyrinogen IX oxidase
VINISPHGAVIHCFKGFACTYLEREINILMKGAIYYSSKFGATRQYAEWIKEETGYPMFDIKEDPPHPDQFDLLVLGSSIFVGSLTIRKWLKAKWNEIQNKSIILFSVSGTEPGQSELNMYLENSLSEEIRKTVAYVPLRGRLRIRELPWWLRFLIRLASRLESDPYTKARMKDGFDYMDKENIQKITLLVEKEKNHIESGAETLLCP